MATKADSRDEIRNLRLAHREETVRSWRESPNHNQVPDLWHLAYLDGEAACLVEQAFDQGWARGFGKTMTSNPWFEPVSPTYWRVIAKTISWTLNEYWGGDGRIPDFMKMVSAHLNNLYPNEVQMWADCFVRKAGHHLPFLAEQGLTMAIPALKRWVMEREGGPDFTNLRNVLADKHKPRATVVLFQLRYGVREKKHH